MFTNFNQDLIKSTLISTNKLVMTKAKKKNIIVVFWKDIFMTIKHKWDKDELSGIAQPKHHVSKCKTEHQLAQSQTWIHRSEEILKLYFP